MDEDLTSPVTDYDPCAILQMPLKILSQHYMYTQTRLTFMRHMSIICTSTQNHYLFKRAKTSVERGQGRMSFYFLTNID
jgi:hypothetical protein